MKKIPIEVNEDPPNRSGIDSVKFQMIEIWEILIIGHTEASAKVMAMATSSTRGAFLDFEVENISPDSTTTTTKLVVQA